VLTGLTVQIMQLNPFISDAKIRLIHGPMEYGSKKGLPNNYALLELNSKKEYY
jgi:hypothetical protein